MKGFIKTATAFVHSTLHYLAKLVNVTQPKSRLFVLCHPW